MIDEFYLPDAKVVYKKIIDMGNKEVLPFLGLGISRSIRATWTRPRNGLFRPVTSKQIIPRCCLLGGDSRRQGA